VKPGRLFVAAVGALVPHKDHATLIRAASIVGKSRPEVDFAVFGEGPLHGSLEALVVEVGLEHRFRLPGHIPETVRSLGDVDVFVMPSREEGLGTACIEAMLAGRPIVATNAGGLGELAGSAFRPVDPGCPEALAREIEILLGAAEAREAAGLKAEERGRVFTAAAMVENTLGCYTQIAHRTLSTALNTPSAHSPTAW
jgi:glycosyltransferase involved in cell wall biosynthesis